MAKKYGYETEYMYMVANLAYIFCIYTQYNDVFVYDILTLLI